MSELDPNRQVEPYFGLYDADLSVRSGELTPVDVGRRSTASTGVTWMRGRGNLQSPSAASLAPIRWLPPEDTRK